jgi:unspecific monooxygenase
MSVAEAHPRFNKRPIAAERLVPPFPTPPSRPLGTLERIRAIRINPIASFSQAAYDEEVLSGKFFGRNSFTLNTPAAIRHVLVDNYENYQRTRAGIRVLRPILGEGLLLAEGLNWRTQRRTLAPAFTPKAVSLLVPHILSATNETLGRMVGRTRVPVDLQEAMQILALEIAGRTMFSLEMGQHGADLRAFVTEYGERLAQAHFLDLLLPLSWPSPRDISRHFFRKRWTAFMARLMDVRRSTGGDGSAPRDLFDLMVAARDPDTGQAFTPEQLGDQVATMILAGHETTAVALFWSLYCLALDEDAQERLAEEARGAMSAGEPEIGDLTYTRAVIDEAMRLYPPAFMIVRAAKGPDKVEGRPVGKGDIMIMSPWILHRHNKLWRQPNAFMPERFLPDAPPIDRFAYLPFGVGPRICIGAHFALTEATLVLAKLIGTFRVSLLDKAPVMPIGVVTTRPDRAPMFRIERR